MDIVRCHIAGKHRILKAIMEHIEQFLRQLGLHQYAHAFERNGYDSLDILFTPGMDDAEWDRLGPFLNIPRGHILRIRDAVYEEKRKQRAPHLPASSNACTPAEASVGSTRAAREPNSTDPIGVPMADLTEVATHHVRVPMLDQNEVATHHVRVPMVDPTEVATHDMRVPMVDLSEDPDVSSKELERCVSNTKMVRVASLNHSTGQGYRCMRDNKRSGGHTVVYRCASVLSKKGKTQPGTEEEPEEDPQFPECTYCLHWKKRRDGTWNLIDAKSTLEHGPTCVSSQKVTKDELVHDPNFVQYTLGHVNVTAKNAARAAIGSGKRFDGSVAKRVAKRAANAIKRSHDTDYQEDWSKLKQWGQEYEAKNPRSRFHMQVNPETRRFERLFVSIANSIDISYGCGLKFVAVDAAFSKHSLYRQGFLHLLTTLDGDNNMLILAFAVCETESGSTYTYFAEQCNLAGLSRYLSAESIIFSDRQKGIENFHNAFRAKVGRCFQHIIQNCRVHIKGSGQTFEDRTAWKIQQARTEAAFKHALNVLRRHAPMAAAYFRDLENPNQVYQYLINQSGAATHGHKTSNIVESANALFVPARHKTPYHMVNDIIGWQGQKFFEREQILQKWKHKHLLTKYASKR